MRGRRFMRFSKTATRSPLPPGLSLRLGVEKGRKNGRSSAYFFNAVQTLFARSNQRVSFLLSLLRVIRKRRGIFPIPLVKERWYIGEGATCVIGNLY